MSRKLLITLAIGLLIAIPIATAEILGEAGDAVSNNVFIRYDNAGGTHFTNSNTVGGIVDAMFGLSMQSNNTEWIKNTAPSSAVVFTYWVSNKGNTTVWVYTSNVQYNVQAGWTRNYFDDAGATAGSLDGTDNNITAAGGFWLDANNDSYIHVQITPAAGANDQDAWTNASKVTSVSNSGWGTDLTYTGMDSVEYGGTNYFSNNMIVVVSGPVIQSTKVVKISNSTTYLGLGGGNTDLVPGSMLYYAVIWSNAGSGDAINVTLNDTLPTSQGYDSGTAYLVNDASAYTLAGFTAADVITAYNDASRVLLSDAAGAENAGTYNLDYTATPSTPAGGTISMTYNANLPSAAMQIIIYRTIQK